MTEWLGGTGFKPKGMRFDAHCWLGTACHVLEVSGKLSFHAVSVYPRMIGENLGVSGSTSCLLIVLFKIVSRWFFANKKLIITLRTSKFGDVTYNVMT